jgi:hypothetical protein
LRGCQAAETEREVREGTLHTGREAVVQIPAVKPYLIPFRR